MLVLAVAKTRGVLCGAGRALHASKTAETSELQFASNPRLGQHADWSTFVSWFLFNVLLEDHDFLTTCDISPVHLADIMCKSTDYGVSAQSASLLIFI